MADFAAIPRLEIVAGRMIRCVTIMMACAQEFHELLPSPTADGISGRARNFLGSQTTNPAGLFARPIINPGMFTVTWKGRTCRLKSRISFGILERLARRPNHPVSFERLLREVWHGTKADDTVRSSVRHLRERLITGGMGDLAAAIQSVGRSYNLNIDPPN